MWLYRGRGKKVLWMDSSPPHLPRHVSSDQICPTFYGTRRYITVFTRAHKRTVWSPECKFKSQASVEIILHYDKWTWPLQKVALPSPRTNDNAYSCEKIWSATSFRVDCVACSLARKVVTLTYCLKGNSRLYCNTDRNFHFLGNEWRL
jgi:hypothetical protein